MGCWWRGAEGSRGRGANGRSGVRRRAEGCAGRKGRDVRGHTARTLALDLLEGSHLGGRDEAALDSVSDREPLVAELVENLVQRVAPLERLLHAQAEVDALAWRG